MCGEQTFDDGLSLIMFSQIEILVCFDRKEEGHGTVGAVALDRNGHIACATSTGGMTGQRIGRVGDTPLIGKA